MISAHDQRMASAVVEVALPPFHLPQGRSPQQFGEDIVSLFDRIDGLPDKVQWALHASTGSLAGRLDPQVSSASVAIAQAIDADKVPFDRQPYHNRQHFCEVVLTARVLCQLNDVSASEAQFTQFTQFILLAALVHDFVHDGELHGPFHLERASVERARPHLDRAGLDPLAQARLAALVLATDPIKGACFAAAACRFHRGGARPTVPAGAPELAELNADPRLALSARLLCEADVLPALGLTFGHSMRLQQRLSREWRRPLDARDKLGFIDRMLSCGLFGDFFLPNVMAARRVLVELVHAEHQHAEHPG